MNNRYDPDTDNEYDAWKDGETTYRGETYTGYRSERDNEWTEADEERTYR